MLSERTVHASCAGIRPVGAAFIFMSGSITACIIVLVDFGMPAGIKHTSMCGGPGSMGDTQMSSTWWMRKYFPHLLGIYAGQRMLPLGLACRPRLRGPKKERGGRGRISPDVPYGGGVFPSTDGESGLPE